MDFEINQPIHYLDQGGRLQPAKIYSAPILSRTNGNRNTPKVSYQVLNKRNQVRKIPLQWILDGEAEYKKWMTGSVGKMPEAMQSKPQIRNLREIYE